MLSLAITPGYDLHTPRSSSRGIMRTGPLASEAPAKPVLQIDGMLLTKVTNHTFNKPIEATDIAVRQNLASFDTDCPILIFQYARIRM